MPFYYRRLWHESRGDEHDAWGHSEWWFEVNDQEHVTRQMEIYATGPAKRYSVTQPEDEFGRLAGDSFGAAEWLPFRVEPADFESLWREQR